MNGANNEKLTEEQLKRIERNRTEALERLRKRQERLLQEQMQAKGQSLEPPSKRATTSQKTISVCPSSTTNTVHAKAGKLEATKVVLRLYSADSFSAPGLIPLSPIYKSIPDGRFSSDEQLWRFPLSQYSNLCKHALFAHVCMLTCSG